LDGFLTIVHLSIILFNLFGWIPKVTRKAHLISILLTAGSWFVLGIWYGMGYCPFTDWQWKVKSQLGEKNLPSNFIEYFLKKITNHDFSTNFINNLIAACFALAALLSLYVNFILPKLKIKISDHSV
jgi:ammonia channel protein AmtB